jgi:hypothetical protein
MDVTMGDETTAHSRRRRTTFVDERGWAAFSEFKAGIIGRKGEGAVEREVAALGFPALHDAILVDLFGLTQIDHVVRGPDAIVVIETKTYGGHITGTRHSNEWTQHLLGGQVRHPFQNPMHQNHRHRQAVEAAVAGYDVPIVGYVVSAGSATFAEELMGLVVPINRLCEMFRDNPPRPHDPQMLDRAWLRLVEAAAAAEPRREEHQDLVRLRRRNDSL